MQRHLITTALEDTWPSRNTPVLFLGEWCKLHHRKDVWSKYDSVTVPYHWDDRKKLIDDYSYLQQVNERLLSKLAGKLNELHQVRYSERHWRILVGPWLGYFIQILYDRWFMLKFAIETYEVADTYVKPSLMSSSIPADMVHFIDLFPSDKYNEIIYGVLLKKFWSKSINIVDLESEETKPQPGVENKIKRRPLKGIVKFALNAINKASSKTDKYFFLETYLQHRTLVKLQTRLGQVPKLWLMPESKCYKNSNINKRRLRLTGTGPTVDNFYSILETLLPDFIPSIYIENYKLLIESVDKLGWPASPNVIFTSNAYIENELFKSYCAQKVEKGSKLIIGQHGGHFGTSPFSFTEDHQLAIADQWLSWGWSDKNDTKIRPIGFLKATQRELKYDRNGYGLLVLNSFPRYSYHLYAAPVSSQWLSYFADQKEFISALPDHIKKMIKFRLNSSDYGWDQLSRWREVYPDCNYDEGDSSLELLVKKSRLYISTCNTTTFLESMYYNVPSLIFWNPEHWELNETSEPHYKALRKANILHYSSESAAKHMADIWEEVDSWWFSENVQTVRSAFCESYAARIDNVAKKLGTEFETFFKRTQAF